MEEYSLKDIKRKAGCFPSEVMGHNVLRRVRAVLEGD